MSPRPEHDVDLAEQLRAEQDTNLLLEERLVEVAESLADLELAADDAGWRRLVVGAEQEFSRQGLASITSICRIYAVKNPLMRRALALRHAYVWGGVGPQISARAAGDDAEQGQDVNAVVQAFLDEPGNRAALSGDQAAEESERALGTDGNLLFALFTVPKTGAVRVRTLPWDEVQDVITSPEDASEPWFYVRTFTTAKRSSLTGGATPGKQQTVLYPAVGYRPTTRPSSYLGAPIRWDAPVVHVLVNRTHKGGTWGTPDLYPALDWSRAYKEFLEDWARLCRALSRFAWRATAKGSRAAKVAAAVRRAPSFGAGGEPNTAGATAVMQPDQTLEAIPKTGATLDSESGRPLAAMVAAATDVPVTMLLADPGVTGARATAETLDQPTRLVMASRRSVWTATYQQILDHVIDSSALAPQGRLKGKAVTDEYGRQRVVLDGDVERTLEITWPDLDAADPLALVGAIEKAAQTRTIPDLVILRLLLQALGVQDADEIIASVTDDQGQFISPDANAGQAAVDAFRRGEDPAKALGGGSSGSNE